MLLWLSGSLYIDNSLALVVFGLNIYKGYLKLLARVSIVGYYLDDIYSLELF